MTFSRQSSSSRQGLSSLGRWRSNEGPGGGPGPCPGTPEGWQHTAARGAPDAHAWGPAGQQTSSTPLIPAPTGNGNKSQSFTGTSQQLRLIRKHNPGWPPRGPRRPSSTPQTSHLWAPLSKPRAGHPPRPSTLRLGVAPLSGPPACASSEHRSAPRPSQPLQRPRARRGWNLPLGEEARPPKLGAPLCARRHVGHPGPGRFLFELCPGTDPQTDPQGGDSKQEGELSRAQSRVDRPQD